MNTKNESTPNQTENSIDKMTTNEVLTFLTITVIETIVLAALVKNYNVELAGETTENGFKASLKLLSSTSK